ncbi:MAG: hypothetical protein ACTSPV_10320 [Candidatus Hodarchaeales archaeon]
MGLRENRFVLGFVFPFLYEIALIESYLIFKGSEIQLFLFLPAIVCVFPIYFLYIFSPYIISSLTGAVDSYSSILEHNIDEIFFLKKIDLDPEIKNELQSSIKNELLPELRNLFRRGYIDSYFTRDDSIPNERMLCFRESLFLLSMTFGSINLLNLLVIFYLAFYSINFDFLYIDQITTPLNVLVFAVLFLTFLFLSVILFKHSKKHLRHLISTTSYNLSVLPNREDLKTKTRHLELDSIRRFPLADKIGTKLAANWDLVAKLYFDFINSHVNEELREFSKKEVARALVLDQYSNMLSRLKLPKEKKKKLELQFYLGQGLTEAIEDIIDSEEETESIKIDILYANKKLDNWEEISADEQISTFLYSWRACESLFRHLLWKRDAYPKDDQSWPIIVDALLREKLLTSQDSRTLKRIRLRRNAMLHRSQDRYVSREDLEDLLKILQSVLDRS